MADNKFSVRPILPAVAFLVTEIYEHRWRNRSPDCFSSFSPSHGHHLLVFCPDDEPGYKTDVMTVERFERVNRKPAPTKEAESQNFRKVGAKKFVAERLAEDRLIEIVTTATVRFETRRIALSKYEYKTVLTTADGQLTFDVPAGCGGARADGRGARFLDDVEYDVRHLRVDTALFFSLSFASAMLEQLESSEQLVIPPKCSNDFPCWLIDSVELAGTQMRFVRRIPAGSHIVTDPATGEQVGIFCDQSVFNACYQRV